MEEKKELYVALNIEKREGDDAKSFVLGVYDTLEMAQAALENSLIEDTEEFEDDYKTQWKREPIANDKYGSFRFVYDDWTYFEYHIAKKVLND